VLAEAISDSLSPAREDYLKALYHLQGDSRRVPTSELARSLEVKKPSITAMLRRLRDDGLVAWEPRGGARLTRRGRAATMRVLRRHRLVETFLVQVLGLDWSEVHEEAEVLEHHLSDRMVEAIDRVLGHPTEDPHGSPIPSMNGTLAARDLVPLASLGTGEAAIVRKVDGRHPGRLLRWKELGLVPGARMEMGERSDMEEIFHVRIDGVEVVTGKPGVEGVWVERYAPATSELGT
jgi:DtxR family Mn-dependent transcriptional regulator